MDKFLRRKSFVTLGFAAGEETNMISIVVPCFNEEKVIPVFYAETNRALDSIKTASREFIFVDDGSSDKTLESLRRLSKENPQVHFISFSRNFGKEAALYAGLSKARGKYIAIMDADLQDPPELLPQMLEALQNQGYDCSAARRVTRKNEPPIRSIFARLFYKVMGKLCDIPVMDGARDFRLMTKKYRDAVLSLTERNRFSKGIFPWVGFKTKWFPYENIERTVGKTKWSFWKLFLYSLDGIVGFTTKPLAFSAVVGIVSIFAALALISFIVVRKIAFGDPVQGWASTVCIVIFFAGMQLFSVGICGLYISKIYTEVKNRPMYIVQEEG